MFTALRDMIIVAVLLLTGVGTASAEGRRFFVQQNTCNHHVAPIQYAAPVQHYVAPVVVAPYVYPTVQTYQPIAVYVMPGTPTAAINVYPGSLSVIQPVPIQLNLNITQPAAVAPVAPAPLPPVTIPQPEGR